MDIMNNLNCKMQAHARVCEENIKTSSSQSRGQEVLELEEKNDAY